MARKRVLITGAGGFIGRNAAERFRDKHGVFAPTHSDLDLLDEEDVRAAVRGNGIDAIVHCACAGETSWDVTNAGSDTIYKNIRMYLNLASAMTDDMMMVHIGTGAEYDRRHLRPKMKETYFGQHVPEDPYGFSKYAISMHTGLAENITCLRVFGVYGRYEDYRHRFISNAIAKNLLHMPITINQNVKFDYLYIDDLTLMIERMLKKKPRFRHYNATPTVSTDLVSIAGMINEIGEHESGIRILRGGMNREYSGDNTRILKELGKFRQTTCTEGIKSLYDHYRANLHTIDKRTLKEDEYLKAQKAL
jgi:nucleoside-diphosphate-sugar epimerase